MLIDGSDNESMHFINFAGVETYDYSQKIHLFDLNI